MDTQKVDMYLTANAKYFNAMQIEQVRQKLLSLDDSKYIVLTATELKEPTTILIISIFLGYLGIDRFLLGDIGIGILKLLTGGVCGILAIIDWFTVMDKARQINFTKIMNIF